MSTDSDPVSVEFGKELDAAKKLIGMIEKMKKFPLNDSDRIKSVT